MSETVIEYVLRRLKDIGIDAIFGVPGDFAFPVNDAIVNNPDIDWIRCCNELNAGYAADGDARLRGAAAVSTTYGVGELSAITRSPEADPSAMDVAAPRASCTGCWLRACSYVMHWRFGRRSGLPFATMFADKSVLDEQHPSYLGMYDGKLMDEDVRAFVESCDRVVCVGTIMTDFNSGAFTANLDPARTIDIGRNCTRVGAKSFTRVERRDILAESARRVTTRIARADALGDRLGQCRRRRRRPDQRRSRAIRA